ncbi:SDR family NAD(P)-dependent oxidoreductase [Deinococcus malanensis]|uniref:SDR family NAD(P)-dependent oxidoreductase n=1 Tax=Deinococcus malanensis TaxID=1706855 RepID=UPI00362C651C
MTGADQGYGRLVASTLAHAGASVILTGNNSETLAAVASQLELAGGIAVPIKADVTVPLDWLSAQTRILEIFGALAGSSTWRTNGLRPTLRRSARTSGWTCSTATSKAAWPWPRSCAAACRGPG